MTAFDSVFAGLPPSFIDRSELNSETLFESSDGSVLQDAKDAYLQDTNHFDEVVALYRGRRIEISYLAGVAQYMNESSRAQRFLDHTCTAVSHGNLAYFNDLKRGFDWGINAMFCVAGSPQQSHNTYDDTLLKRAYDSMVATVNTLNGDNHFTLPTKSFGPPLSPSEYESRAVQRPGRSCELTGALFIPRNGCTAASNCIAAHNTKADVSSK